MRRGEERDVLELVGNVLSLLGSRDHLLLFELMRLFEVTLRISKILVRNESKRLVINHRPIPRSHKTRGYQFSFLFERERGTNAG